jgi:c-di-GMP-binding flagellar brake protein YcgR
LAASGTGRKLIVDKFLQTGSRVEIRLPGTDDNGNTLILHSRFEESMSDFDFILEAPFYKGGYYPLPMKEPLEINFYKQNVPHSFEAVPVKRLRKENFNFIQMRRIGEVARHQMREAFRLECHLRAFIRTESDDGDTIQSTIPCQIVNISYGGARVAVAEPLERNAKVQLLFYTSVDESITSEVRSVAPADSSASQYKWFSGLRFEYDELVQSRRVSALVNEMQRQMLKSGRRPV